MRSVLLGLLVVGWAQQPFGGPTGTCSAGELPETAGFPRDPVAAAELWHELEGSPGTLPELYPSQWEALQETLNSLLAPHGSDDREAMLLAAARSLWDDYGAAEVNEASQYFLTELIADSVARQSDTLSPWLRQELAAIIQEYVEAGGAGIEPEITANVGRALASLAPGDAEIQQLAGDLIYEATIWDAELSVLLGKDLSSSVSRAAQLYFGPPILIEMYDLLECRVDPDQEPGCYRRYCETIEELVWSLAQVSKEDGRRTARVAQLAGRACAETLRPCGSEAAQEDLRCRFLMAMELLLSHQRETVSDRLANRISVTLASLAVEGKLTTRRAWERWAKVASALGDRRMSSRLARLITRELERKEMNCLLTAEIRESLRVVAERALKRRER